MNRSVTLLTMPNEQGRAVTYMCIAMAIVPLVDLFAKLLGIGGVHPFQIVSLRMGLGFILLAGFVVAVKPKSVTLIRPSASIFLLGGCIAGASVCFFASLYYMNLADAIAITFVQPLIVTLLSRYILKEKVSAARWIALLIGFTSCIAIIKPGSGTFTVASFLPLAAGAFMAIYAITIRSGISNAAGLSLTLYVHLTSAVMTFPFMIYFWTPLSVDQLILVVGMSTIGLIAHYLIITAYGLGEASIISSLTFLEIVGAAFVGWLFFNELPDSITAIGVLILIICAAYTSNSARISG